MPSGNIKYKRVTALLTKLQESLCYSYMSKVLILIFEKTFIYAFLKRSFYEAYLHCSMRNGH